MTLRLDSVDTFPAVVACLLRCFERVHVELGPGFAREVYRQAMALEIERCGQRCLTELAVEVFYREEPMGMASPDLIVANQVLVVIDVARLLTVDAADRLAGLVRATGWPVGALLNFGPIAEHWLVTQAGRTAGSLGGFTTEAIAARHAVHSHNDR